MNKPDKFYYTPDKYVEYNHNSYNHVGNNADEPFKRDTGIDWVQKGRPVKIYRQSVDKIYYCNDEGRVISEKLYNEIWKYKLLIDAIKNLD